MSRHRFVRNLTEDDYYDDYYEDEDEDYNEIPAQPKQKPKPKSTVQNAAKGKSSTTATITAAKSNSTLTPPGKNKVTSTPPRLPINTHPHNTTIPTPFQNSTTCTTEDSNLRKEKNLHTLPPPPGFAPSSISVITPTVTTTAAATTTMNATITPSTPTFHQGKGKMSPKLSNTSKLKGYLAVDESSPSLSSSTSAADVVDVAAFVPSTPTTSKPSHVSTLKLMEYIQTEKSRLSMVVLGHVDAGKSTLMGQVLLQLGYVEKRIVNKYKKQAADIGKSSFALAWVMDEDESEREHGVTMDIATRTIETNQHIITILDSPGHADFIPAMITGAAAADVGILVVAATKGEFEAGFRLSPSISSSSSSTTTTCNMHSNGGQTREHIILARGLGVSQLIVAVNKLDAAEPPWSEERFHSIQNQILPFLKTNGFNPKRVRFVPISGLTGVNVNISPSVSSSMNPSKNNNNNNNNTGGHENEHYIPELASWYHGPTLMEAINSFESAKRDIDKPLRFIISDVYTEGKGVICKGRLVQGYVSVGDKVIILPLGDEGTISRIDHGPTSNENCERMKVALAGDYVDIFLYHVDSSRIFPGNIITTTDMSHRPPTANKFIGKIVVMEEIATPIIQGTDIIFHMHNVDIPAVISKLVSFTNKTMVTGTKSESVEVPKPRVLNGGVNATVEVKLKDKICLEAFQECRALGRFVLRRSGDTIAVGIVEKVIL